MSGINTSSCLPLFVCLFVVVVSTGLVYLKEIVKEQPELLAHHHLHQLRL